MTHVNTGDTITESDFTVSGRTTVTTNVNGNATIGYGTTFVGDPSVVFMVQVGSSGDWSQILTDVTSTNFEIKLKLNGSNHSGTRIIHWHAHGTRA